VPGKITYYYDGVLVGTIVSNIQSSPMYMILVYGASRIHGGPVAVPATMSIDYVRVWQKY
jgi:beta-glucanase (GH16 family)